MIKQLFSIIVISLFLASCAGNRNVTYFKDISDSLKSRGVIETSQTEFRDPSILPNDILQISIKTIDPQATSTMVSAQLATSDNTSGNNYLVNANGEIELPVIGKIGVGGNTTTQAKELILSRAKEYYINPIVNIKLVNFKVTVLGEVNRPGQYVVPDEKINVIDALGLAGDLTIYGRRENVLLIRTSENTRKYVKFDLNSSDVFNSPYFYLRQGDIIYVEPGKAKIVSTDATNQRLFTMVLASLSILVTSLNIILR